MSTPGTCGGKPRIAGHRITVKHVVLSHQRDGMSPDEIVSAYPSLTLADVHAALAYYFADREPIDADIRLDDEHWAERRKVSVEVYTTERKAQFLLSNAVNLEDYAAATAEVRAMGLDPATIPHTRGVQDRADARRGRPEGVHSGRPGLSTSRS